MFYRLAVVALLLSCAGTPAFARGTSDICALHVDLSPVAASDDARGGAAPADVDFGLYPMSVLGIANTLKRDGEAIDDASDRNALTTGPLACVVDSIRSWERAYPADPWIAKDLLTLEVVYLRAHSEGARDLAARTEAWLEHDYPLSNYVQPGRLALGRFRDAEPQDETVAVRPRAVAAAQRTTVVAASAAAFAPLPIRLAAAPVPGPVVVAAAYPAMIRPPASPWDRFAPLVSDNR